jgi:murein L,D-transpeptidase YcbB/YkuD
MACVESGYGTSTTMRKHNAFLGQKVGTGKTATTYWDGLSYSSRTKEEYTVGHLTTIRDNFRAYKSMQQCVLNYYELLNSSLYRKVTADVSPKIQMLQIKQAGYMTSSKEVNTVLSLIDTYNLTRYDLNIGTKKCTYHEPNADITKGTTEEWIKWIQWMINNCGIGYNIEENGIFDDMTLGAVLDFQKKNDLVVDGIVGTNTRNKLKQLV